MKKMIAAAALATLAAGGAHAASHAQNWDMPMAYADSNFHSQNGKLFAEAVGICTGGALNITVHAGGSLFGGADIKRAVQTGWELPLEAGLALERELQAKLFASDDAKEGIRAFVEKRPAAFQGK